MFIGALAVIGVLFFSSSVIIRSQVTSADHVWRHYQDISSVKARSVDELVSQLGFGQMIHQFKNLVLRKQENRVDRVQMAGARALGALDAYELAGVGSEEQAALDGIRGVVREYMENAHVVMTLAGEGKTAKEIDGTVKISDGPALNGIAVLSQFAASERFSSADLLSKSPTGN
jgi:methyl-accepting chemotaxis protein